MHKKLILLSAIIFSSVNIHAQSKENTIQGKLISPILTPFYCGLLSFTELLLFSVDNNTKPADTIALFLSCALDHHNDVAPSCDFIIKYTMDTSKISGMVIYPENTKRIKCAGIIESILPIK